MTEHLGGNRYSSDKAIVFSKQIKIISVNGPFRHPLWHRYGWRVQIMVQAHFKDGKRLSLYWQDYEAWPLAIVRVGYYKLLSIWHNIKYRRYHR